MTRKRTGWIAALVLASCAAPPAPDAKVATGPAPTVVMVASADSAAPPPPPVSNEPAPPDCVDPRRGARCPGALAADEARLLGPEIERAAAKVQKTSYTDVRAIIDLSRLQLRRDEDTPNDDGATDAARGLKNAMRSVAVDETSAAGRLVLAIALTRSLESSRATMEPTVVDLSLGLTDIALDMVPRSGGSIGAAAATLKGYLSLERGRIDEANASFQGATQLDPRLGTAWIGLGDVARAESHFDVAKTAYETARASLRADRGLTSALQATDRHEALELPSFGAPPRRVTISPGPLSLPSSAIPVCSSTAAAASKGASICKGLVLLSRATARIEKEDGAHLIIDGFRDVLDLCQAHDPACGPHVADAMAAASRAFHSTGRMAKAIATAKMLLSHDEIPGARAVGVELGLEVADLYFALGVFDIAADYYLKHARDNGSSAQAAFERALALNIALARTDTAVTLAEELAKNGRFTASKRADWLLATAALVRATRSAEAANVWLAPFGSLLSSAGAPRALAPVQVAAKGIGCSALLACAVRRLVGETW